MRLVNMGRMLVAVLCIGTAVRAQQDDAEPAVTIHRLTINASDVSAAERQRMVQEFQGGKYTPEELAERVRQELRDQGYFEAKCDLDGVKDSGDGQTADINLRVTAGAQYKLLGIRFTGADLFPAPQLRALFAVEDGALINSTEIGRGLERMKNLYAESGYADFGCIPKPEIDESHHTVGFTVDADPGKKFSFGRLLMDGVEPQAGAAQSLQDAWISLHEKQFSPKVLNDWLTAHAPYWPGAGQPIDHVKTIENPEIQQMDVVVQFP
jgi:outer membrane translocation and assembly module TamA